MSEVQLIARQTMKAGTDNEVLPLVEQLVPLLTARTIDEFYVPEQAGCDSPDLVTPLARASK